MGLFRMGGSSRGKKKTSGGKKPPGFPVMPPPSVVTNTVEFRPDNEKVDSLQLELNELKLKLESFQMAPPTETVTIIQKEVTPANDEKFNKLFNKMSLLEKDLSDFVLKNEELKSSIKRNQQTCSEKHDQFSKHNERQNQLTLDIHKSLDLLDSRMKKQAGLSIDFDMDIKSLTNELKKQKLVTILLGVGLLTLIILSI